MSKRSKWFSAIVLAALIAATAAVAVTAMASPGKRAVKLHSVPAVSARLDQIFTVLRSDDLATHSAAVSTVSQSLPQNVLEGMGRSGRGLEPTKAAFAGGVYPTWVVPGTTEVCLVVGAIGARGVPGSTCGSIAQGEAGLALMTETDAGAPIVLGLAPNGNASVEVTNADGAKKSITVTNNVYEITGGRPSTVSLKDASGASTTQPVAMSPPPPPSAPAESATP
jgi:hypothetical protein